jgi:pilus assembly protein CpaC
VLNRPQTIAAVLAAAIVTPLAGVFAPAYAFEVIDPDEERSISLVVGSGQLIKVDAEFSSLFVANPDVADVEVKSPRLLYLTGIGVGETTLFAVDDEDNVLMSSNIMVTHNLEALQRGISRVAPGQSITATTVDQSLVLTGSVGTPEEAANVVQVASQFVDDPARVVNRLDVATPTQVNVEVRIAEINRNVDRQLGIRWNAFGISSDGDFQYGFVGGGNPISGSSRATIGYTGPRLNIDVVLEALADEGLVTILAEPNLTARSGESASFLAGGEYPYSTVSDEGTNVEFKDFGIGLNFTPVVLSDGRISMRVATEVSDLNFANNESVPSLVTRRAETTVDLASGQSFAIAGLMQNRSSQNINKVPGLGSIPVLGALFRSNGFQRGQTELVIIVTPIVAKPTAPRRVVTPVDKYVPPNDFERILLGRFKSNEQALDQVQNQIGRRRLYGRSGFVFD